MYLNLSKNGRQSIRDKLDEWIRHGISLYILICCVQSGMSDCDVEQSGKGPTLKDLATPDLCNTSVKPFVCIPSGACCRQDEWCHCGHCLTCYPDFITTESEKRDWCVKNGHGDVSRMQHVSCSLACYATFGPDIFLPPQSQSTENWKLPAASIALIAVGSSIIAVVIGIVLGCVIQNKWGILEKLKCLSCNKQVPSNNRVKKKDKTNIEKKYCGQVDNLMDSSVTKKRRLTEEERQEKTAGDHLSGTADTKGSGHRDNTVPSAPPAVGGACTQVNFTMGDQAALYRPSDSGRAAGNDLDSLDTSGSYETTGNERSDGNAEQRTYYCNESNLQQEHAVIATSQAKHGDANDRDRLQV